CTLGDECAGAHDRILADNHVIQERRPHTNQAMRFHGTTMQPHSMPDGHIVAKSQRTLVSHHVHDRSVLNICMLPDSNDVYITTDHAVVPDAGVIPDFYVANDLCTFGYVDAGPQLRPFSHVLM